ncbi:bifunctional diaminohydroxyphosphoribosylaminopyrimidine deaminase/5-amino-6-(5-phosphoribosylamino)uracil reductase RibD [Mangrovimonas sp. AS39]|uniref:bifunctional diaminohydroxyphosphoribosylaminopyrimidine deaminase/5-amino-6-(5-phosphoribosylamino)uracil reductase RibD n=1 Tax=Mangrovimonas futianensis TaxID=2895523 RepID=UPI001E32AABB|nr:bifunctional diaminohydroxyphosphoribosylaminopyrimidine deaminase/5-amino-6-(5-phosphoribosylamino)uracil reductase RibD [Mangrovimonas futianensis]MCF1192623.1 bifunctional diaminohydroxyphosphoribosylaminopyrimidine deaminase/5-amino-6-(5-phosphoribosylamino)uracil reductase RibD [Mangrovimonas futianensis]MCF1196456.1 bifunctional diaminohydroxyphosphoribosylaminopyrimidine deaminase/5-amino-6-(5-phosphoribosylamino)uracil reductase RibD [Mangrovimonas futianensis]
MKIHEKYINRCIEIAKNGLGTTRPNPMVGCVIVRNDQVIGEGFTSPFGGPHAEVNAINSVKDESLLKESTLYVTLEPCSHFGKTPPCSDLIIDKGIPQVVIGTIDTHSKVAGKGIEKLMRAGCDVVVGVLEKECQEHHKRFFTFHNKQRPYIILKWAQSADGFLSPSEKDEKKPVWITNSYSRQLVHKWRTEEHAILVGYNTVIEDNPSLTARDWKGLNPIRVVLDKFNSLEKSFDIFNNEANTIIVSDKDIDFNKKPIEQLAQLLFQKEIQSIIIEGGSKTLQMFLDEGLWDEARIFIGQNSFVNGTLAPQFTGSLISEHKILGDTLKIFNND